MQTNETNERYLEAIYFLCEKSDGVHAIDVCKSLGFSKPTVSVKLKQLSADGFITVDENEHILLTRVGKKIAAKMGERHRLLTKFLIKVGVDEVTAETDACKIEHDISDLTFEKLKAFLSDK